MERFMLYSASRMTEITQTQNNESGIRKTAAAFAEAFNRHDAHALAETFAKDADFSNVRGDGESGRDNIARFNEPIFERLFSEACFTYSIRRIRFLTPDIAVVDIDWEITGSRDTQGNSVPLRIGRIDWVMTMDEDRGWFITVMHNRQFSPSLV